MTGGALAELTDVSVAFIVSGLAQLAVPVMIYRLINRHRQLIADSYEF